MCCRTICSVLCAEIKMFELGVVISRTLMSSVSSIYETGGFDNNLSSSRTVPSKIWSPKLDGPASGEGVGRRAAEVRHVGGTGVGTGMLNSFPALLQSVTSG